MKIIAYIRWVLFAIILQIILIPSSYILFPLAYLMRNWIRKNRFYPLWIFLDDEEFQKQGHDYGEPWWRESKGLKIDTKWNKFKAAYLWNVVRNPAWNQYKWIKPKEGISWPKEGFFWAESYKGELTKNGIIQDIGQFAVLKYVDRLGAYMDNKGPFLSLKFSVLGKSKIWYRAGGKLYWRFSKAGYNKLFKRWYEIQLGTNNRRYTFRLKFKKTKVFEYDAHLLKYNK